MSLFEQILSAIDNPEQEASTDQLSAVFDTIQKLSSSNQANPQAIQSAMSVVGNYAKSALQEQRTQGGAAQVNQLLNQFGGTQANSQVLSTLFNGGQLKDMMAQISRITGLDAKTIQAILPILVPLVLSLLRTGNRRGNLQANNPVLSGFLDSDGDGDVDVNDMMNLAFRHLGR